MTNPPPADQTCFGHLVLGFEICYFKMLRYSITLASCRMKKDH